MTRCHWRGRSRVQTVVRGVVPAMVFAWAALASAVFAQSRALLTNDPGADLTVYVDFTAETTLFGTLIPDPAVGVDTAPVTGTALMTLYPAIPPFTHCTVHAMTIQVGELHLSYRFLIFFTIDANFSGLTIASTGPFNGTIDPSGNLFFPTAPIRITGTAHLISAALTVDEIIDIDAVADGPMAGLLGPSGTDVLMGGIALPSVRWDVPPELLPSGITALNVGVVADASRIVFRGPYGPALLGDADADNDVDLADLPSLAACLNGPETAVDVYCSLFRFDADADVDLWDGAEFLAGFSGP